jgi:glycosyltransferase involved in cell wall biosynthesis
VTRILANATTITVGGGVQAAVSFVEFASKLGPDGPTFLFALSKPALKALPKTVGSDPRVLAFEDSPAHLIAGRRTRRELLELERQFAPDLVYSIGFPSYVKFNATEAGRYTNPWEICSFPTAESTLTFAERTWRGLRSYYRLHWARRAHYFETQTEIAKAGIIQKLRVDDDRIFVITNSVNPVFAEAGKKVETRPPGNPRRIFCLSAEHRHKNLMIIPEVARQLAASVGFGFTFVLTLPPQGDLWQSILRDAEQRGVANHITNTGPLSLEGCVQQYRDADCLFLPTLVEIFSATYLEAMVMRVPIVTTDLDFAHDICQEAALYYDPLNATAAANAIESVLMKPALRQGLVSQGIRRMGFFPDPETKHRLLVDWLAGIARHAKTSSSESYEQQRV